ncbi:tRNA (adenosine(37)-N6)-threonylcarbamoyltransferase complex ATPase subunit type 1 TsaE [Pusillimonas sp. SM2304]|uniref:tRNA (adenosine(37)-N6)-threonylcarbamoyltransferase complex ATPase subunit type 1 TsaE n=1 Tax=Pusillimonas sp. SM2304 TaxID=3073241 RepID=UPI002876B2F0|nr:tRNA (adenosine(37)-N6)-threonylcarbamoyltransferase complex ATPase subunit type 1 TsaE [Pusillimonas sp. SM2304]MDS1142538.1 tRNA (adenosine(37)-N6)-threonylcarbamoyltransferase complex ATPase subunit type 1 TsaE [Pusillimonas sp. SM2304]
MNKKKHELSTRYVYLKDEEATSMLAAQFAPLLSGAHPAVGEARRGGRIHLRGDLGAGKTSFARALLRASGITGRIKSPSYALLESYNLSNLYFYHLDFYRFSDSREWLDAGFRDILQKEAIVLIEWPEQAGALLPPPDLDIHFDYADIGRCASLTAHSDKGILWLTTLALPTQESRPPGPRDAG